MFKAIVLSLLLSTSLFAKTEYMAVCEYEVYKLNDEVTRLLEAGYKLQGGISVAERDPRFKYATRYCQAMTRVVK